MVSMHDVVALGEILIDFTPAGKSKAGNVLFERNPGGAPANVLAAVTRLGGTAAFIGKVGDDAFGRYLKTVLDGIGIVSRGLRVTKDADTTLAFVHLDSKGDRSFSFYRRPGADTTLKVEEVDLGLLDQARIFHFGSLSLTNEPARRATLATAAYAKSRGLLVSYDPNWRPPLWESDAAAKAGMLSGLPFADLVKVSETELAFLTGEKDLATGSRKLFTPDMKLLLVTLGPKGCFFRCAKGTGHVETYDTRVVDTTGAGDAFVGGLLYRLSRPDRRLADLTLDEIGEWVEFSCAVGSLCATKRGAIPAMPTLQEVADCRTTVPKLRID
jgi:fructokinase